MTTTCHNRPMAWTNQRIKYSAKDCINLKTLWKLLMLDDNKEGIISNHVRNNNKDNNSRLPIVVSTTDLKKQK